MRRGRSALAAAAAVALSCSLLSGSPAEAEPTADSQLRAALAAAPEDLQTPFEQSDGAEWTTHPESLRYYRQLDAASDRVRVTNVGRTVQDRPLQLVAVGAPTPDSRPAAAEGSVAMFVCSVHGDEPSGREACMTLARELAFTTDAALTRFLERTTVLFINANPDGWVADTRENADDVDVNRDYMALETPEARAVTKVIRDWNPDVLNDLHEYGPREYYDTDLLHLWPRNRNVDDQIHQLAQEMSNDYSAAQVTSTGRTAGIYGQLVKDGEPFLQVAGDEQARILRNYAGLVNVVGMLSETANAPLDEAEEEDESLLNRRRVEVNHDSAVGTLQMVMENRDLLAEQTAAAAERHTEAGAEQSGVIYFAGQDDMLPTDSDEVEPEPMCGYQLTGEQFTELRSTLNLHGITTRRHEDGRLVPLAQPTRGLIPLLLDERSEYRIAEATPLQEC
ncbi:carboxypeptidase [Auraticoccus sp. F435]|uniref:Carboxypeptidase n=1 Tax=Auraticoccus cholistanensis TaxID=2656650 RepID=A0A6A9UZG8_9ACTN|nr:M14 family zinc carboxypeptidase [Auraticoccus cholistanensis]MVA77455.1 carboxypeptidase [Auraticoccus cholistanensis]